MSTNHTSKYALSQWLHGDPVLMDDFNEDNRKLDSALTDLALKKADLTALTALSETVSALPRVAAGTYNGDGSTTKTLSFSSLGRPPKLVCVQGLNLSTHLLAVSPATHQNAATLRWSGTSLVIDGDNVEGAMNVKGIQYAYFAVG